MMYYDELLCEILIQMMPIYEVNYWIDVWYVSWVVCTNGTSDWLCELTGLV